MDVAPMINVQIHALSPQDGTVDLRSLTGMQFVDGAIVVDHPVNLLGAVTFTERRREHLRRQRLLERRLQ